MVPTKMKAFVVPQAGHAYNLFKAVDDYPVPKLGDNDVLVEIRACGVAPVDWKQANFGFWVEKWPVIFGRDGSGVVVAVGKNVTRAAVGDEVLANAGVMYCVDGTFAQYLATHEELVALKPRKMSFEVGAGLPVAVLTAGMLVFTGKEAADAFTTKKSKAKNEFYLVWGAATSVGMMTVQFAAWAGYTVVAVCSKKNFKLMKTLGASYTFDYSASDVDSQIADVVKDNLRHAADCVSAESAQKVVNLMSYKDSIVSVIAGDPKEIPKNVTLNSVLIGAKTPEQRENLGKILRTASALLESGDMQPLPVEAFEGFEGITESLKRLTEGKASANKYVATISRSVTKWLV
jgi:NADPH:quinone reductase-like Zn-dependent oxidoreductase